VVVSKDFILWCNKPVGPNNNRHTDPSATTRKWQFWLVCQFLCTRCVGLLFRLGLVGIGFSKVGRVSRVRVITVPYGTRWATVSRQFCRSFKVRQWQSSVQLEKSTKTGPDWFIILSCLNWLVVVNCDEMCNVSCNRS